MANSVEGGLTPDLPISELEEIGCLTAVYQLTLLAASIEAMKLELDHIKTGSRQDAVLMGFLNRGTGLALMNIIRHRHAMRHPIASDGSKALPFWQKETE